MSELLFTGQVIGSETFKYMQVYLVIAAMYLAVSYPTSVALRYLERRLDLQRPVRAGKRRQVGASDSSAPAVRK